MSECYAGFLGECDGGISREHYISKKVLDVLALGGTLNVAQQTAGKVHYEYTSGVETVAAAKVLCKKHNSFLSALDSHAGDFFTSVYHCTRGGIQGLIDFSQFKTDLSGRLIEKWLLKMACGAIASGSWGGGHRMIPQEWVRVLFGFSPWPEYFNLYSSEKTEYCVPEGNHARVDFRRDPSNSILQGVTCVFMPLDLTLVLGPYHGVPGLKRPSDFIYKSSEREITIKLSWV